MAAEKFPLFYSTDTVGGTGQDRLNSLNGNSYSFAGFQRDAIIDDKNNSDRTDDRDTDDITRDGGSLESWTINGVEKNLLEVATYNNSTIYTNDGNAVTVDVLILLFDDGTVAFTSKAILNGRANDISSINPNDIDISKGIKLGTQYNKENDSIAGFQNYRDFFVCFTQGTMIETADGMVPIETLKIGDAVRTEDNGYQPVRWIGSKAITQDALARNPKLLPIRIKAGSLGQNLPERDLTVSRQHRVMLRSQIAQRMFGTMEVLVPAIKLVGYQGIEIAEDVETVIYWHILFDKHEIIFSEGAPTESLFAGPEALKSVSAEARQEIEALFPEIMKADFTPSSARFIPEKGKDIKKLIARHTANSKPLL